MLSLFSNEKIVDMLGQSLVKKEDYIHSYPYDWRTKKPVITVASLQWFVRNDKIKETALKALEDVRFFPDPIVSKAEMTHRVKQVRRKIGKNFYAESFYKSVSGRLLII